MAYQYRGLVKTTLDLPDDLLRSIKLKAAREDRSIKAVTTELLRRGLAEAAERPHPRRAGFPLIDCPAGTPAGLSPDEIADALLDGDARAVVE